MPYLGSEISLISKSEVRYVGILTDINQQESTVALENVRSFGTEGRLGDPAEELPGSDEIYPYVVFRGADVKDLHVMNAPAEEPAPPARTLNDPAIVSQKARPPTADASRNYGDYRGFPPAAAGRNVAGPEYNQRPDQGYNNGYNYGQQQPPSHLPPKGGDNGGYRQQQMAPQKPAVEQKGKPASPVRKSQQEPEEELAVDFATLNVQDTTVSAKRPESPKAAKQLDNRIDGRSEYRQDNRQGDRHDNRNWQSNGHQGRPQHYNNNNNYNNNQHPNAMNPSVGPDYQGPNHGNFDHHPGRNDGMSRGRGHQQGPFRPPRGQYARSRGMGRPGPHPHHHQGGGKIPVPDSDFDFEGALAKFNKSEVATEAAPTTNPEARDEDESSQDEEFYQKSSFFDNISCESKDRNDGQNRNRRARHFEERRLNMETFGQTGAGNRGYRRGGYRGYRRGGGGGRSRGGMDGGHRGGMEGGHGGQGGPPPPRRNSNHNGDNRGTPNRRDSAPREAQQGQQQQ
ncbi:Scd6-like Sm domain-containing protein [Phlyctochytrium arcticum]|nr:Scd6-like Sm domain-containing protein [Phlyctochytrium arcticum]